MDFDNVNEIITPTKSTSLTISGTGALFIPAGTVGERPVAPQSGYIRFNTSDTVLEYYNGVAVQWQTFGSATLNSLLSVSGTGMLVQTSPGVYAARSIAGTTNRVTLTNGDGVAGNPTVDISSSYVGQATITTLGTVGTGTWNATTIAATVGGTGQTVYAVGDILYANTTTTLAKLADIATGNALISGGVSTAPSWGKIGLATHVSGTLPIANGGTNLTTLGTANQILGVNAGATALEYKTVTAGTAISVTNGAGSITIANTGVTSNVAGTGISVSGATGAVTITNTGVTSAVAGTGISVSGATGAVTFTNTGATSIAGTTNQITASAATGAITLSTPTTFTAPGYVAITTGLYESTTTGITAAGATLGTATALTTSFNLVSTVAAGTGVSLPAPTLAGWAVTIRNGGANTLNIYPNSATATINGGAAGTPITLATGATVTIEASTAGASSAWFSRSSFGTGGTGTVTSVSSSSTTGLTLTTTNPTTTPAIAMAGTLNVGFGGTGVTTTPTNGQLLIGNGTNYTVATLGSGTGISTTTGAGTLTINNTGVTSIAGTAGNITASAATGAVTLNLATAGTAGTYATVTTDAFGRVISGVATQTVATGGTGLTSLGTANQILGVNAGATALEYKTVTAGTGISVTNGAGSITIANTGVTSVGLALPVSVFTVSGSPVTTTGTLTGTFNTQANNTVFAGPATGGPLTPTFRTLSLAGNDIADVLITSATNGQTLMWNGADWVNVGGFGSGGTLRTWSGNIASQSGTTTFTIGTTPPTTAGGTEIMTLTLTPPSTSSKYVIEFSVPASASTNNNIHSAILFRGTTYLGAGVQTFTSGGNSATISFIITDAPATTSSITYSIRYGTSANTWYINRRQAENTYGGLNSGWVVTEF